MDNSEKWIKLKSELSLPTLEARVRILNKLSSKMEANVEQHFQFFFCLVLSQILLIVNFTSAVVVLAKLFKKIESSVNISLEETYYNLNILNRENNHENAMIENPIYRPLIRVSCMSNFNTFSQKN